MRTTWLPFAIVVGVAPLAGASLSLCAVSSPSQERDRAKPSVSERSVRTPGDYLWLLKYSDKKDQVSIDLQRMLAKLENGKVPTERDAEAIAVKHKMAAVGGILAEEGSRVVGLIKSGVDESGFASRGDFLWIVRFTQLSGQTTYEVWISSETGIARTVFPASTGKPGR